MGLNCLTFARSRCPVEVSHVVAWPRSAPGNRAKGLCGFFGVVQGVCVPQKGAESFSFLFFIVSYWWSFAGLGLHPAEEGTQLGVDNIDCELSPACFVFTF